jgi:hypothetical protein
VSHGKGELQPGVERYTGPLQAFLVHQHRCDQKMPMLSKHFGNICDVFASFKVCLAALATEVSIAREGVDG